MGWLNNPKRAWEKKVLHVDEKRARRAREQEQARQAAIARQQAEDARRRAAQAEADRKRAQAEAAARRAQQQREAEALRRRQQEAARQQQRSWLQSQISQVNANVYDLEKQLREHRSLLAGFVDQADVLAVQLAEERSVVWKFEEERNDNNRIRCLLIGLTGHGKSTFANRLIGDDSEACESGIFAVSDSVESVTSSIQKEYGRIIANGRAVDVSVIDTPGFGDSRGLDRQHSASLVEYLRGIEKVHVFVWVRKLSNPRLNGDELGELRELTRILGRGFWRHVVLVLTGVDTPKHKRKFVNLKPQFQDRIRDELGLSVDEAPLEVLDVGLERERYVASISQLFALVRSENYFTCDELVSPLDELSREWESKKRMVAQECEMVQQLDSRRCDLMNQRNSLQQQLAAV